MQIIVQAQELRMNYERIKNLKASDFKRLYGVRPETFNQMVAVLKQESPQKGQRGGQPKLSVEDQLLMTLQKGAGISDLLPYRTVMGCA